LLVICFSIPLFIISLRDKFEEQEEDDEDEEDEDEEDEDEEDLVLSAEEQEISYKY